MLNGCAMVWTFGCRLVNGETRVQSRASPHEICVEVALGLVIPRVLPFSPVSIIPPLLLIQS